MKKPKDIVFVTLLILTVIILVIPTLMLSIGPAPPGDLRRIAKVYVNNTYNAFNKTLWTASPEAVAAIVWDYRGLDTFYETIVFYTAIVSCLILYREVLGKPDVSKGEGLSIVVKRATAISFVGIVIVGSSTILHGMLTPGGGFQGGSIVAVAPAVLIVVFSRILLDKSKLTYRGAVLLRNIAIMGIALTALAPTLITLNKAFIFQNQAKPSSTFTYPGSILDVPMGGSIWFYNLFEGIAVFTAFYLAFKVILYSEETSRETVEGEDYGY